MDSWGSLLTILQKQKIKRHYNNFTTMKNLNSMKICKRDLLNSIIRFISNLYFQKMYSRLYNSKKMNLNNNNNPNKQIIYLGQTFSHFLW